MNQKNKNKDLENDIHFHLSTNLYNQTNDLKNQNKNKLLASIKRNNYKQHENKLNLLSVSNLSNSKRTINEKNTEDSSTLLINMNKKPIIKKKNLFEMKKKNMQKEDKNKEESY